MKNRKADLEKEIKENFDLAEAIVLEAKQRTYTCNIRNDAEVLLLAYICAEQTKQRLAAKDEHS